ANDGMLRDLVWYQGQRAKAGTRVMSVDAARLITQFLADPSARLPSFPRMGATEYPFPVAIKTGTSQGYRDAWTMAYSRDYLVGVWVGRADAGPMQNIGGAQSAAELARDIMLGLYPQQPDPSTVAFAQPEHYQLRDRCGQVPPIGEIAIADDTPDTQAGCSSHLPEWQGNTATTGDARMISARDRMLPVDGSYSRSLHILSPKNNLRLIRNPELPPDLASLALKAESLPAAGQHDMPVSGSPMSQILWYIDGKPFQLSNISDTVRWPLQAGQHVFQARTPYSNIASSQ